MGKALLIEIRKENESVDLVKLRDIVMRILGDKGEIIMIFIDAYIHLELKSANHDINPFKGLTQGSALSPNLFCL